MLGAVEDLHVHGPQRLRLERVLAGSGVPYVAWMCPGGDLHADAMARGEAVRGG